MRILFFSEQYVQYYSNVRILTYSIWRIRILEYAVNCN